MANKLALIYLISIDLKLLFLLYGGVAFLFGCMHKRSEGCMRAYACIRVPHGNRLYTEDVQRAAYEHHCVMHEGFRIRTIWISRRNKHTRLCLSV